MIDPTYQPFYDRARQLQYQLHDAIGGTANPQAFAMRQEMQHLVNDLEVKKNPRDIENRIATLQRQVLQARSQPDSFMSYEHIDHFHDNFDQMRQDVRRLSAYN
ncbi:MAG TPA: hypothetical protein VF466_03860 [Candidatus Saccharimonadales bacterium]